MRLVLLSVYVMTVAALPALEEPPQNGENGWFVPQYDGSFEWWSLAEATQRLQSAAAEAKLNRLLVLNDVSFYLYTRRNPTIGQKIKVSQASIATSNFRAENPTRFTIHGWTCDYKHEVNTAVRATLLAQRDYNMIAVDWQRARSVEYVSSVLAIPETGKKVANLIDFLTQEFNMTLSTLQLVGFSLGAHVAGHAAKQVQSGKVQQLVGLDPAMPLISYKQPAKRLNSSDALYVESIQTNGGTLGYVEPIGSAAFYPNGGQLQPGCFPDLAGSCSHSRAVTYYVESLELNSFASTECDTYYQANRKACGSGYSRVRMGATNNTVAAAGVYFVPVHKASPYGLGKASVDNELAADYAAADVANELSG